MIAIRKFPASSVLVVFGALLAAACSRPSFPTETTVEGATSTAPSTANAKQEQKTLLRFINATGGPKDLYFQDVLAFRSVESAAVTSYLALPSPRADAHHELKLYDSANPVGTPLITDSEPETNGHRYTVLALRDGGKFTLTVIPDQLKPPAPGKAKIRVIHAAPGADKLDVFGIVSGLGFGRFTEYKELGPTTTELVVGKRKLTDVKLEAGKLYTIVLLGGEGKPLSSKLIEDELIQ